jgi:coenzyme Q-binding protein COQ10
MPRHAETRNLPYTPEQLFDLVTDVRRYPEFLPWVAAVRVRSETDTSLIADLVVGFKSLKETYASRVTKRRPDEVTVENLEGPLRHLRNDWRFEPDGKGGTDIHFHVDFTFKSRLFDVIAGQVFDRALARMIGAFEARAHRLYGACEAGISSSSAHKAA